MLALYRVCALVIYAHVMYGHLQCHLQCNESLHSKKQMISSTGFWKCSSTLSHFLYSTGTSMCNLWVDFLVSLTVIWCFQHANCLALNSCISLSIASNLNFPLLTQRIPRVLETFQTTPFRAVIMSNKGRDSKVSLMMDQGPAELIRQATLILHHWCSWECCNQFC